MTSAPVKRSDEYFKAEAVATKREFAQYLYIEAVVTSQGFAGKPPLYTFGEVGIFIIGIARIGIVIDVFRAIVVTGSEGS